ncbi:MAG: cupin domain-containing protein [Granulosicoccus sp.]
MTLPEWLHRPDNKSAFYTNERCTITELVNSDASPHVSVAKASVAPGQTTQLHCLRDVTEHYILCKGEGVMHVNGRESAVVEGDRVTIPAGEAQQISNTGTTTLEFLCVCTPRFTPDCYIDLEGSVIV